NGHVAASNPPPSLSSLPLPPSLAPVSAPAPVSASAPAPASKPPPSVLPDSKPLIPMAPVVFESKPPPAVAAPVAVAPPVVAAPVAVEPPVAAAPVAVEPPVAAAPVAVELPHVSSPAFELNFESTPFNAAPVERTSSPDRSSRPRLAVAARRRAGEDLISELFEIMHDLHFMRDVAAGSEFVLSVLDEVLPCEGALVHVFDINTSHFVIVRAKGPNGAGVLLQRMSDQDPMLKSVMRAHRTTSVKDVSNTPRFLGPRWPALGIQPRVALCGPVQQGGRYLGLIELVNPLGDTPFHQSEINALDYICEQFAEFLSKKPIVLTADVVLARS
ncbi:MAG: GAF domain-containing protein, partial [Polyangiaceae bacterium]